MTRRGVRVMNLRRVGVVVMAVVLGAASIGLVGMERDARGDIAVSHRLPERAAFVGDPSYFPGYDAGYDTTQPAQPLTIVQIPL
jgi:hypothetical protein